MKIGAQLYTVRELCKNEQGIADTFAKIVAIGYQYVQVSGLAPIPAERLRDIARENKLEVVVTHTSPERILHETDKVMHEHEIFGCRNIGIGSLPAAYKRDKDGFMRFCEDYSKAAAHAFSNGFKLHYHNHRFEFEKFDGVTGLEIIANNTPANAFGFILDTYWIQAGGGDSAAWIEKFAGRTEIIHLKDMMVKNDNQAMCEVGEGNINFDSIYKACDKAGVRYAMVEQDECTGDPLVSLEVSYKNLKKAGF